MSSTTIFLLRTGDRYSATALGDFTASFYADAKSHSGTLPEQARITLERIIQYDLLGAYRRIDGVEQSLRRLSVGLGQRWRRNFALDEAVTDLRAHEGELWNDFSEFFPDLQAHMARVAAAARAH